ncbi:putative forkhead-associated (FHA) domain, SMAD/FHA domain superfamily [Plasmopara halstedii]
MTASCCFQLQITRGPHSANVHRYCHFDANSRSSFSGDKLSIGRKRACWLRLPQDLEVSSVHAEFRNIKSGTSVVIRDVKSTNGTKVNGKQLQAHEDYSLSDGDLIAVGKTSLRFVQMDHGQSCSVQIEKNSVALTKDLSASGNMNAASLAAVNTEVIVVDGDLIEDSGAKLKNVNESWKASVDQPDIEPSHDKAMVKPIVVYGNSGESEKRKKVETEVFHEDGAMGESMSEEATCTNCKAIIGQLDLLEQQAHLNECLGGRVFISAASSVKPAKPKRRQRGKTGGKNVTKRPRKPKASEDGTKARIPRKRKRIPDAGENIKLALAIADKKVMSKEEMTDEKLAMAKMKLAQVDEQMAKLTKQREKLVKSLDRLEKMKEKLRESQVLPPAKVSQLLNVKAALDFIFPSCRQARPFDRPTDDRSSVAKRYAPSRWNKIREGDEKKQDEVEAVDAISMWARASQQLFALQSDTLLYRNSVLRPFLGADDIADAGAMTVDQVDDSLQKDGGENGHDDVSEAKIILTES